MKYEGECIKPMEWIKFYENCMNPEQINALNLLLLTMFGRINETMNMSN